MDLIFSYILIFIIIVMVFDQFVSGLPFHLNITADDREEIFGTSDINVPEHELILVSYAIHQEDEPHCMKFKAFNETISLKLRKMDSLLFSKKTPIWLGKGQNESDHIDFTRAHTDAIYDALKFFEDPKHNARISVNKDTNGNIQFLGYLKDHLELKKVPESSQKAWLHHHSGNLENHYISGSAGIPNSTDYHIIIKKKVSAEAEFQSKTGANRMKRDILSPYHGPDPIYPRIMVYVNFIKRYPTSDRDDYFTRLLIYLICFWNAVDMKYMGFENPKIRLHIVGIVIAQNEFAAPYFDESKEADAAYPYLQRLISKFSFFISNEGARIDAWDIAISQSDVLLCRELGCMENEILGLAYIGQTCNNNRSSHSTTTALVADDLAFRGVLPAVHEIGHLFGASHDGSKMSLCKGDGFVMSARELLHRTCDETWSWCSRLEILERLRFNSDKCWNNTPSIKAIDEVPELLPGHLFSLRDQCITRGFEDSCDIGETTCQSLYCRNRGLFGINVLGKCEKAGVPFPGSSCGKNMHCKFNSCVLRISGRQMAETQNYSSSNNS